MRCTNNPRGRFDSGAFHFAVCPGGEGAVLKTVGCKRLAGSNPVHGVWVGMLRGTYWASWQYGAGCVAVILEYWRNGNVAAC